MLGIVLFVLYSWLNDGAATAADEIIIDDARIAAIRAQFEGTWSRPPTPDEQQNLVEAWIKEEIFFREGLTLGLDENDQVVRRRVVQKYQYINEDQDILPPSEADLESWLQEHADDYIVEPSFTLQQVYFDSLGDEARLASVMAAALEALQADGEASAGDPTMLPSQLKEVTSSELARIFGQEFAQSLDHSLIDQWQGPIASSYGEHLVRIAAFTPARQPDLAEVRSRVENDLLYVQRNEAREAYYSALRNRYTVRDRTSTHPTTRQTQAPR